MKRTLIFLILIHISVLLSATNNQWDRNKGEGSESFLIVFDLTDTTNVSDLYTDIGFSRTPLSNGSYTSYEDEKLTMTFDGIDEKVSPIVAKMSATTYAYWHMVIGVGTTISLKISPKSGAAVQCSFNGYTDSTKKSTKTVTGFVTTETSYNLVSLTKIGRSLGSTEISIEAELTNYYYTDDVICTLTLVTKTK